jgi:dimeric dUTPase (all-alpha-NTP-PPase superfamily)
LKDDLVVIQDKHMINKKFNKLFKMISDLKGNKDKKNIKLISAIYKKYVALGINLGFNIEQIKEAYFTKHEVNIKRQENKY